MSLFHKKEESKKCPLCGKELKFFSSQVLADGNTICEDCVNQTRNHYSYYYRKRFFSDRNGDGIPDNFKFDDEIRKATLEDIKEILKANEEADEAAAERAGDCSDMFVVESSFLIAPKATDVGLKRAKLFKNKTVVQGRAAKGHFGNEEEVTLLIGATKQKTVILGAYKNTGEDLYQEMAANMQKKGFGDGESGWLILDLEQLVPAGSSVIK